MGNMTTMEAIGNTFTDEKNTVGDHEKGIWKSLNTVYRYRICCILISNLKEMATSCIANTTDG